MANTLLKVAIIQLALSVAVSFAVDPGMVSRVTPRGFDFLAAAGRRKAEEMARGHRIPDQSGSTGPVSYHVSGMKITSFQIPRLSIRTENDGLWVSSHLQLSINGHFHYSAPFYSADGSFDATVGDMSTTFYIRVGADTRGRPHVSRSYLGCCNADHVSVDLHGQPGWISDKAAAYLQDYVNDEACPQIFPEITNMINQQLRSLTMLEEIYDGLELDYSFVSNPRMQMSSFDINHKGEVYAIDQHSEAPGPIASIPVDSDQTSMFYVWITDYLVNSAGYVLHSYGYLERNVTENDIPTGTKFSLNTSGFPLSVVFPQVRKMFPDMMTQFHVNSTEQPVFRTTTEKMTIIICGDVSAFVMQEDDTLAYLFTLGARLTTSFNVAMKGQNVTWRSKVDSFKLELLETAIGDLNIDMIKRLLPTVMNTFINKMGAVGRNLPSFQGYYPTATNITLGEGFLKIGTDIQQLHTPFEDLLRAIFFNE
ncbi:bactericidal permeability-increasing protein-like isoform X1 [Apostichopus japonicus]|uniref:bactericidal permeability-increasing protein-like isoform X1 n=1 Tax=Stichopus japonicus TaxID=307972 RepID=UPI003AB2F852